jgi:trimethylamine:corrinoid methyltransferase-like protein
MNMQLIQPWQDGDLELVVRDAVRVLVDLGVRCDHAGTVALLRECGLAEHRNGRLRFDAKRLQTEIDRARANPPPDPGDGMAFGMGGCWPGLNYCDPVTNGVRPGTTAEAEQMARFWDARGVSGPVPLMPGDVPPALVTLTAEWIGLRHSRALGGSLTVTDPEEVRYLRDMNTVAGRRYSLTEMIGISPLCFDSTALEAVFRFKDDAHIRINLAGFIATAGATCPLDPLSAAVQTLAEELAVDCVGVALGLRPQMEFVCRIDPFDFRYGTIVFGSPEWCLYNGLVRRLRRLLRGGPDRFGAFRSVAKQPDAHAATERTGSVLWQAMQGVRQFGAVGQLCVDEIFSPVQAILDGEILGWVARLIRGFDPAATVADPLALIRAGVEEESFLGVDNTVENCRAMCDSPDLFRHWNLGRWRAEGAPTVQGEAWKAAQALIARADFHLPDAAERDVNDLYAKARNYLASRPTA